MTKFFFPDNKCGIGGIVERPVFKFVADCNIEPTPRPIFDCPLPIIAREPEIPCPEFNVKSKLDVGFANPPTNNCDVQNKIKLEIKKKADDSCPAKSNSCEFDVDLEVEIAFPVPPCPTIKVDKFSVKSGYADQPCVEDESRFEIRSRTIPGKDCTDPGSCEFDVDLEIVVPIPRTPCPEINVNTFSVVSDYSDSCAKGQNRFEIKTRHRQPTSCNDPGECKFDVDLEVYIPLPRPACPEIAVKAFDIKINYPVCIPPPVFPIIPGKACGCDNKFSITKRHIPRECGDLRPPECEFDVELAICIPPPKIPCPEIKIKTFEVKTGYANSPCVAGGKNTFEITRRIIPCTCDELERCEFDIALELVVPIPKPPCPVIEIKKFEVKSDYADCAQGQNRFVITPRHVPPGNCVDDAGECNFDIELEINVPIPRPPCPEIKIKSFDVKVNYPVCVPPTPIPGKACGCDNKFSITKTPKPAGCGNLTPEGCDFEIELAICIPPPKIPCPEIKIKTFKVLSDYQKCLPGGGGGNKFTVNRRIIPCTCDELERCEFDIELEIEVPLPEPPCPEIRVVGFSVNVGYPTCVPVGATGPCGNPNKFTITKTPKPVNCGDLAPEGCDFDVTLDINIPAPKIPCPEIKIKTFKVVADYQKCLSGGGGGNKFTVNRRIIPCTCDELERCEFDIELEIEVPLPEPPCPDITGTLIVDYLPLPPNKTPPADCNVFRITKKTGSQPCIGGAGGATGATGPTGATGATGPCEFDIELKICVPVPEINIPCPKFNIKTFKVETKFDDCLVNPPNKFVILPASNTPNGPCEFDIELEIYVPVPKTPCPEFGTSLSLDTFMQGCGIPGGIFEVTKEVIPGNCNTADTCVFYFDLAIAIPYPRFVSYVAITSKQPKINVDWCVGLPQVSTAKLEFVRQPDLFAGACDRGSLQWFEARLDLDIVLPPVPCVDLYPTKMAYPVTRVAPGIDEFFKLHITPKSNGCQPCSYEFSVDLQLQTNCTTLSEVAANITPCVYGTFGTFADCVGSTDPADMVLSGGIKIIPVGTPDECKYTLQLELEIPIYRPPSQCDVFNPGTVNISYTPFPNGNQLIIKPGAKPPGADPEDDYCVYDVELNAYIEPPTSFKCPILETVAASITPCVYGTFGTFADCVGSTDPADITLTGGIVINRVGTPDECKYTLQLELEIPIYRPPSQCDVFNGTVEIKKTNDAPSGTLTITPGAKPPDADPEDDYCVYDAKLELLLKEPCTIKLTEGKHEINPCLYTTYAEYTACPGVNSNWDAELKITQKPDTECEYELSLYMKPPVYLPPEEPPPPTPGGPLPVYGNVTISSGLGFGTVSGTTDNMEIVITLETAACPQAFTALPMTANDTINEYPWDNPTFVDNFIQAVQSNKKLRTAIKNVLLSDE